MHNYTDNVIHVNRKQEKKAIVTKDWPAAGVNEGNMVILRCKKDVEICIINYSHRYESEGHVIKRASAYGYTPPGTYRTFTELKYR